MKHEEFAKSRGYEPTHFPDGREAYIKESVTGIIVMEFETDEWVYLYKSFGLVVARTYPISLSNETEFLDAQRHLEKIISFPFQNHPLKG